MLDWIWKSKGTPKTPENKDDLDFLDPSLKEHYESSKPITPISLAPESVQKQYEKEAQQIKEAKENAPNYRQKEEGLHQIEERAQVKGVPLGQAARNNCVEYEMLLANCSLNGTYWERLNLCQMYRKQQIKCVDLQTEALKTLGYTRANSDQHRTDIQNTVDDAFSSQVPDGPITDESVKKFEAAIEKERQKTEIYRT